MTHNTVILKKLIPHLVMEYPQWQVLDMAKLYVNQVLSVHVFCDILLCTKCLSWILTTSTDIMMLKPIKHKLARRLSWGAVVLLGPISNSNLAVELFLPINA
jgi:hypothetical protein